MSDSLDDATSVNPYATSALSDQSSDENWRSYQDFGRNEETPATLTWTITRWTLVCTIAAAPSFFIGLGVTDGQIAAMTLGVMLFIAGYVILDRRTMHLPWRRSLLIRRTMQTVYVLRLIVSIVFPVGAALDMICGLFSISIVTLGDQYRYQAGSDDGFSFIQTLATTIVQGFVLNIVLAVVGLVLMPIIALIQGRAAARRQKRDATLAVKAAEVG